MKNSISKNKPIVTILSIVFWIFIWWLISLFINREIYLPFPLTTLDSLVNIINNVEFWETVTFSILRVMAGFLSACILGIILGFSCGLSKLVKQIFNPLIIAIRATPVMSFIIIAIIWFDSNFVPIFVGFLMCFPIIWGNVVEGVGEIDQKLLQMSKVYNINKLRVLRYIYIPSLVPYIVAGMTTALGIGWKATVAAEVLSHPKYAIGTHLYDAKVYLESTQLFAWTIVVIALSFFFEYIIKSLLKLIQKVYG